MEEIDKLLEEKEKKFYQKWWFWVIVAVVILGIIGSFSENSKDENLVNSNVIKEQSAQKEVVNEVIKDEVPKEEAKNVQLEKSWHKVTEITGKSDKVTDTFEIKGEKWRYNWDCVPDTTYGKGFDGINIFVYPEDETAIFVSSIFMASCNEGDENFVYSGKGKYYFDVGTANLDSWSIIIEDYY